MPKITTITTWTEYYELKREIDSLYCHYTYSCDSKQRADLISLMRIKEQQAETFLSNLITRGYA